MQENSFNLTRRSLREIKRDVRLGRSLARNSDGLYRGQGDLGDAVTGINEQWLRLTSASVLGGSPPGGYYPALLQTRYSPGSNTFIDLENGITVYVSFPRGFVPQLSDIANKTVFLGRQDQDAPDGTPLFVCDDNPGDALAVALTASLFNCGIPRQSWTDSTLNDVGTALKLDPTTDIAQDAWGTSYNVADAGTNAPPGTFLIAPDQKGMPTLLQVPADGFYLMGCTLYDLTMLDASTDETGSPYDIGLPDTLNLELWVNRPTVLNPFASQSWDQTAVMEIWEDYGPINELVATAGLVATVTLNCSGLVRLSQGDQIYVNVLLIDGSTDHLADVTFVNGYLWGYRVA